MACIPDPFLPLNSAVQNLFSVFGTSTGYEHCFDVPPGFVTVWAPGLCALRSMQVGGCNNHGYVFLGLKEGLQVAWEGFGVFDLNYGQWGGGQVTREEL